MNVNKDLFYYKKVTKYILYYTNPNKMRIDIQKDLNKYFLIRLTLLIMLELLIILLLILKNIFSLKLINYKGMKKIFLSIININ